MAATGAAPMRLALLAFALALWSAPARAAAPAALDAVAAALAREVGPPARGTPRAAPRGRTRARRPSPRRSRPRSTRRSPRRATRSRPHRAAASPSAAPARRGRTGCCGSAPGLVPGRREVAVVGELIPAWASFFLQRRPDARAVPPRIVQARASADPETLLLAREAAAAGAPFADDPDARARRRAASSRSPSASPASRGARPSWR